MKMKCEEDILRHHVDHHAYQSPVNKYFWNLGRTIGMISFTVCWFVVIVVTSVSLKQIEKRKSLYDLLRDMDTSIFRTHEELQEYL